MKLLYIFSKKLNITQNNIYVSNGYEPCICNEKLRESILFDNNFRYIYFYLFDINNQIKIPIKYKIIKVLNVYPLGITISDFHSILNRINFRKILKRDRMIIYNHNIHYLSFKKLGDYLNDMIFIDVKKFDYNKYAIYITNLY